MALEPKEAIGTGTTITQSRGIQPPGLMRDALATVAAQLADKPSSKDGLDASFAEMQNKNQRSILTC